MAMRICKQKLGAMWSKGIASELWICGTEIRELSLMGSSQARVKITEPGGDDADMWTLQTRVKITEPGGSKSPWALWWSYEGLSGPSFWGEFNPEWTMCKHGRQQSPINIEPSRLLYDPNLKHLQIDFSAVKGYLINTGPDITLKIQPDGYRRMNVSLGPLSYNYTVTEIKFHFGNADHIGSEHRIASKSFPVEMHVIAYNLDLYANTSVAASGNKGLAIVAVFMEIAEETNKAFNLISKELKRLRKKGSMARVHHLALEQLLPSTDNYITYDGSLTQPGCQETVTWLILNKPIYISKQQLSALRVLYNGRENNPELPLEINARPLMPLNHRVVRTNINFRKRSRICTMERDMHYQGIEGNICGFNLRRDAHSSGHYFQDGRHFSKWPPFFEVRTLKMIEITDFNDFSVDSKTEY
ncbi:carbonic anhydrase-related protein 10-like [Gigantopelta aegis]|uniref:carbonic anhydrase-related protein 10-like n=1 Tax=Gigantopelta aegis TaxID=1735272 RepID=UPI001B88AA8F|nr:carbonic anhydrase-related protein 10-like [Gigantopelta aegis]